MPELPEAETILQGLRETLPGRRFETVEVVHADLLAGESDRFLEILPGLQVADVQRRGKNLVLSLATPRLTRNGSRSSPGSSTLYLTVNLGMSGRLLHRPRSDPSPPPSHPGVRFRLDDGSLLVYADVRRFGRLRLLTADRFRRWSRSLGPEPLSRAFTGRRLSHALAASSSPIRSWLLDQRRVAGVGNIYANEALFSAGVHPRTPARELTTDEARRLHRALRSVLRRAVRARGTTLRDYRTATGEKGSFSMSLHVYGREGAPCPRCRAPIRRSVFGGRSAFFCGHCQRERGSE